MPNKVTIKSPCNSVRFVDLPLGALVSHGCNYENIYMKVRDTNGLDKLAALHTGQMYEPNYHKAYYLVNNVTIETEKC